MTLPSSHHRVLAAQSEEWNWLLSGGPHGSSFSWHREVRGYSGINHLRKRISEAQVPDRGFPKRLRVVARQALGFGDIDIIRRAIQVLCVVGTAGDLRRIERLLRNSDATIRKDARACLFERGIKK